jgi:hypothetical protein
VTTRTKRDPEQVRRAQIDKGVRPLWVLTPGSRPELLSACARHLAAQATHYCREGDARWRPIHELEFQREGGEA